MHLDEAPSRGTSTSVRGQRTLVSSVVVATALWWTAGTAHADSLESLVERLDRLEQENRQLRSEIDALKAARQETVPRAAAPTSEPAAAQFVRADSDYGYEILDPATHINRKQRLILERKKDGTLAPDRLHVQGASTAIANYQSSNRDDKFGYPTTHELRLLPGVASSVRPRHPFPLRTLGAGVGPVDVVFRGHRRQPLT